jgi:hypothetical protein
MKEINAIQSNLEDVTTVGWDDWDVRVSVLHVPLEMVLKAQEETLRTTTRTQAGEHRGSTAITHTAQAQVGYQDLLGLLSMRDMRPLTVGQRFDGGDDDKTVSTTTSESPMDYMMDERKPFVMLPVDDERVPFWTTKGFH